MFFRFLNKIKIYLYFLIVLLLTLLLFNSNPSTETNLLKTILPSSIINNTHILNMANKSSSVIRIVFEADDEETLYNLKDDFLKTLDNDFYASYNAEINNIFHLFIDNPSNFLSYNTRQKLIGNKFDDVYENAMVELFNPMGIPLTEVYKDPYFLLSDYLKSQNFSFNEQKYINGKYYDYLILNIKNSSGLSPSIINKEIKKLIEFKNIYSKNSKVYYAGTPVHTYLASQNSIISINVICLLATVLITCLTLFFFRSYKNLLPIIFSISMGFFAGYVATITIFNTFHVLTLVFATTIIGIGVDYSYHYMFAEKIDIQFIKNLFFSLLTTVTAFLLLYFSNIELLQEISIFVSVGLIIIFLTIILVYPYFKVSPAVKSIKIPSLNKKNKIIIASVIALIAILGLFRINFNDTLISFYEPSNKLKKSEILFNEVSNQNFGNGKIIAVKGHSFEEILQKEEKITDLLNEKEISFISLSKIFPSIKRQKENIELVKNLYKSNLNNFSNLLNPNQIFSLKNEKNTPIEWEFGKYNSINNFMLNQNTSLIFVKDKEISTIIDENIEIIDINESCSKYLKEYRYILLKLLPVIFISIFIILGIIYKPKKAFKMILPPLSGCLISLSIYSALNLPINMFTLIAMFLIIGFTIDYSIFRVGSSKNSEDAIFLSCITTLFSFFALSFVSFKFISSLSFILFLGILTSYIVGMLLIETSKE